MIKAIKKYLPCMAMVTGLMFGAANQAIAAGACPDEGKEVSVHTFIGSKIYERTFGRGCGTCHDVAPNPNLLESVKKLSQDEFATVVKNGRNGMPKAGAAIMGIKLVKKSGMSEDEAINAVWTYLSCLSEGKIPAKVKKKK
jgi:mono/diheme cytochrome c family protein